MKNPEVFNAAKAAYAKGDYQGALRGYYSCLKEQMTTFAPGEAGMVMHMIGNCLIKMHKYDEATEAYGKALVDKAYPNTSAVRANAGMALLSSGHYDQAIEQFNAVLKDPAYRTPYKIYNGLGSAYMKLGDLASAGTAFRSAAVDEGNPNPVKALLNLGVCFMGLNRPLDAIETYNTVFSFEPDTETMNKTYANLGQAYVALGEAGNAVGMFEQATADGTFTLSDSAAADYQAASDSLADRSAAETEAFSALDSDDLERSLRDAQEAYADPWEQSSPDAGFDQPVGDYGYGQGSFQAFDEGYGTYAQQNFGTPEGGEAFPEYEPAPIDAGETVGAGIPSTENTGFFDATDEQIIAAGKRKVKGERKRRHVLLKVIVAIVIVLLILIAGGVFAFTQGYGYPTQQTVVENLFSAVNDGSDTSKYWVEGDSTSIQHIMDAVGQTSDVSVQYLTQSMDSSEAIVKADLTAGGEVYYRIDFSRDMLSWKVNSLELYYPSQQ